MVPPSKPQGKQRNHHATRPPDKRSEMRLYHFSLGSIIRRSDFLRRHGQRNIPEVHAAALLLLAIPPRANAPSLCQRSRGKSIIHPLHENIGEPIDRFGSFQVGECRWAMTNEFISNGSYAVVYSPLVHLSLSLLILLRSSSLMRRECHAVVFSWARSRFERGDEVLPQIASVVLLPVIILSSCTGSGSIVGVQGVMGLESSVRPFDIPLPLLTQLSFLLLFQQAVILEMVVNRQRWFGVGRR
mmetsp:Transcript_1281/g.2803  ORF Transcript_1281/g.2803 Transcript_1281/m.2803 type:complete len:243 (-) Transcript_1281:146-874(-)